MSNNNEEYDIQKIIDETPVHTTSISLNISDLFRSYSAIVSC